MSIPPLLNQEAQFAGWMQCLHALLTRPLPLVRPCGGWRVGTGRKGARKLRPARVSTLPVCHPLLLTAAAVPRRPCPQDQLPSDPDARKSWMWSKSKKWAVHIASRLFNRCAAACGPAVAPRVGGGHSGCAAGPASWAVPLCAAPLLRTLAPAGPRLPSSHCFALVATATPSCAATSRTPPLRAASRPSAR